MVPLAVRVAHACGHSFFIADVLHGLSIAGEGVAAASTTCIYDGSCSLATAFFTRAKGRKYPETPSKQVNPITMISGGKIELDSFMV
jgi:hypothetical protein